MVLRLGWEVKTNMTLMRCDVKFEINLKMEVRKYTKITTETRINAKTRIAIRIKDEG